MAQLEVFEKPIHTAGMPAEKEASTDRGRKAFKPRARRVDARHASVKAMLLAKENEDAVDEVARSWAYIPWSGERSSQPDTHSRSKV